MPAPRNIIASILLAAGLAGCGTLPQKRENPSEYAAVVPAPAQYVPPTNGSIYQAGTALPLFEDLTARRVGDILTILLSEKTDASKKASTSTAKESTVDTGIPTLFGSGITLNGKNVLQNEINSSQEFEGSGDSSQSNSLSGTVTVSVAEVLPNGNLFVRGQKRVTLNQGEEYIQLSGIVRPADVRADNSVPSTLVADARITYSGRGAVADSNSMGWLSRFFVSKVWPF